MTLETGRSKTTSAFTLLEVLIALSILATGLTLLVAGFSQQLSALRFLETSRVSHSLVERLLVHEILLRDQNVDSSIPEVAGFRPSVRTEEARIPRGSLPDLEMERVIGQVSWELRGVSRSVQLETGVAKKQQEQAP